MQSSSTRAQHADTTNPARAPDAYLPPIGVDPATLRRRVTRDLPRLGRLPREDGVGHDDATLDPDLLAQICAASVQGYGALFPKSPPLMVHLGRSRAARTLKGSLCCNDEGFSLHAHGCVPAGLRERLQRS